MQTCTYRVSEGTCDRVSFLSRAKESMLRTHSNRRLGKLKWLLVVPLYIGAVACATDQPTSPLPAITRAQLLEAMTPEASALITPDGKLELAPLIETGRAQISGEQAALLAVAVARFNLAYSASVWDAQRGKPISYGKLVACGDPLYAESPFKRLTIDDPVTAAHPLQKGVGPFWLVKLCAGGEPQMNIAVSAYSTDLSINPDGGIKFPATGGGDFLPEGISASAQADELPSPEAAVVLAAGLTRQRVAAAPRLVLPFFKDDSQFGARWYLELDRPARMTKATGEIVETSQIYISRIRRSRSPNSRQWLAETEQPDYVEVTFVPLGELGETMEEVQARREAGTRVLHANRRPEVPIRFIPTGSVQ